MTDSCCEVSEKVTLNIGETANFSCEYSQNHINDVKIIFKEEKDSIEMIYSRWKKKERFSISDDKHKNIFIFTVNITDLREEDSGIYWCGANVITKVHLNVSKDKDRSKITVLFETDFITKSYYVFPEPYYHYHSQTMHHTL
uniref:Ig-like domain-containing protein n=1 Tax=Sinocyclocheilus rhinocerous TaxID=307959 RepID=A0A673MK41_9TELE